MTRATASALHGAADLIRSVVPPTPQYSYPLLNAEAGIEVWVKHENHTPVGAFKVRGGLVFMDDYARTGGGRGVVTATRGNHGQSIAFAATRVGIDATIVVPEGNSVEKNAAMQALGGRLVIHGHDFQASVEHARVLAEAEGLHMLPSFHPHLIAGVGTYAMELLSAVADLDVVYVPIGLGSGICGLISARDALGLKTEIVGVVSTEAPAYALSFEAGRVVTTNSADTLADGMATRVPVAEALETILTGAARVIRVTDDEVKRAIRLIYRTTHNIAEGAGAAPLAGLMQERAGLQAAGSKAAVILCGGNIDRPLYRAILAEEDD